MIFVNLFVYGTLMDPDTRADVIGRSLPYMEPDSLCGFSVETVEIENTTYPALVPNGHNIVHGAIIILHEDELKSLDEYETDVYKRQMVRLMSGKEAWVFVKKEVHNFASKEKLMEEKVLYNVLRQVSRNESITAAPDDEYVKALEVIGIIDKGWDRKLTDLGNGIFKYLDDKLNPWGT
jgi:gamma-glutamylcyclotransferase (GGCT)/AIG2-like uncharacterized protein YtfP